MKKYEVVSKKAIIAILCIFYSTANFAIDLTVPHALQKGFIKLDINALGGHSESCIQLKVCNTSISELNLTMEPGTILDNLNEQQQDIIVVKTLTMKLKPLQKLDTVAYGFCCQSSNSSPVKGQKFRIGKRADTLMIKLCKYIDKHKIEPYKAQHAIWTISNHHKLSTIGNLKDTSSAALFEICNEFRKEPVPWYFVVYSKMPGVVFSNIPCRIVLNFEYSKQSEKELVIAVYNSAGHKVKTLLANSYASAGLKSFHFDFETPNWENGTYTLKVKELDQQPVSKTFEL